LLVPAGERRMLKLQREPTASRKGFTMAVEEFLASSGAGRLLGVSSQTVRNWARQGILPVAVAGPTGLIFRRDECERVARERDEGSHAIEK
jgi:hypothetical protein